MWGGGAKLVAVLIVWETMRKGKGPGKAILIQTRDVSGFIRKENLGFPYHRHLCGDTRLCQDATPLPRESWPTFVNYKALTIRQAGHLAPTLSSGDFPSLG